MLFEQGLAFGREGRLAEAREALKEVWRLNPERTDALIELAQLEREQGDPELARAFLSEALGYHPQDTQILLALGKLFHEFGQLEFALNYYHQALKLDPTLAAAWHQLGRLFHQLERYEQAEEAYQQALKVDPELASAWNSLGLLYFFLKETSRSREHLQKAIQLKSQEATYYFNLGMSCLLDPVDLPEALENFELAQRLNPDYAEELIGLGNYYMHLGLHYLARPFYLCALKGKTDHFELFVKLAQCAERECEMQAALDFYNDALQIRPDQWLLKIRAALLLPLIYNSPEHVKLWRKRFAENLEMLHDLANREKLPRAIQNVSIYSPAFLLAYQGIDNKLLLDRLSDLWSKLFALPETPRQQPRKQRRRIGLVSAYFYQHSISGTYIELVRQLRKLGHDVYCFSVGLRKLDSLTDELQSLCHWTVLPTDQPLPRLAEKIIASDLDLLIYPEIGLNPLSYFLAHGRLAPIQVQLYGHPISSGIKTMDYFISSQQIEIPGAQEHYREELVQLPRCPFYFERTQAPEQSYSREELGLPEGHIYLVPGTLFKIHPNHDAAFAQILERDPQARIVLIQAASHQWHDKLWQRFELSLTPWIDRVHFIPWMPREKFYSLLQQAEVVLDTVHFSAGNVGYQALALGVPIITLPGSHLRSRMCYGLYAQMGMLDCVANSWQEYIELALRMAHDLPWREAMRQKVLELSEPIFEDRAVMLGLAQVIERLDKR